jgi:transcriptional regulator NrdR family protein
MADEDELYYLQPGYKVGSLTMPKLRGILTQHDVSYPSAAKKAELVSLVEAEILPNAKKLLRERDRIRRTSAGITDMSSQDSTVTAETSDDRELMPPPKTPRSRKSKTNLTEPAPSTSRRSKTPTSRKSSSRARVSDTETEGETVRSSARKTRKSAAGPTPVLAPSVKLEEPPRVKREAGESPFSDDNPFQQGSSPSAAPRRVSSSRRKSTGRPGSSRRSGVTAPIVKVENDGYTSYQFPVQQLRSQDYVPVSEEFTPDAAQEVAVEDQLAPQRTRALVRRKKKKSSPVARNASLAALTSLLAAAAAWYRQEKISVGYCGVGSPEWSLADNPNLPPWVHENLGPVCEPCPQHAVCFPKMEVHCDTDFVLQQHPLSLGGLVPIPPTCEPDSEKERRVKAVADKAIEELRERRAAYECGEELPTETPAAVEEEVKVVVKAGETKLEISEEALKAQVSAQRRRDMSPAEFDALFEGALEDIKARDEVEVVRDGYVSSHKPPAPPSNL